MAAQHFTQEWYTGFKCVSHLANECPELRIADGAGARGRGVNTVLGCWGVDSACGLVQMWVALDRQPFVPHAAVQNK